jgi:hypothetical protein
MVGEWSKRGEGGIYKLNKDELGHEPEAVCRKRSFVLTSLTLHF